MVAKGMPKQARGRFDDAACTQWYIAYKVESATAPDASTDVNTARRRLYDAQVIKTNLETERARRETIPADIHLADMLAVQQIFNTALDGLDGTLADDLADLNDPAAIADRLTAATHAARESVADNIVAYAATVEG